jgi:hypothetical protein
MPAMTVQPAIGFGNRNLPRMRKIRIERLFNRLKFSPRRFSLISNYCSAKTSPGNAAIISGMLGFIREII